MDRLTFDGNFCDIAQCRELPCPHGGSCTQRKVWEKLKAYEDTGLTPEEVNDVMAKAKLASAFGVAAERLSELAKADKAGRLMVLPEGGKSDGCDGCSWKGLRHQRCSCCRRNRFLKDGYTKKEG